MCGEINFNEGFFYWDFEKEELDENVLEYVLVIINFLGVGIVDKWWIKE